MAAARQPVDRSPGSLKSAFRFEVRPDVYLGRVWGTAVVAVLALSAIYAYKGGSFDPALVEPLDGWHARDPAGKRQRQPHPHAYLRFYKPVAPGIVFQALELERSDNRRFPGRVGGALGNMVAPDCLCCPAAARAAFLATLSSSELASTSIHSSTSARQTVSRISAPAIISAALSPLPRLLVRAVFELSVMRVTVPLSDLPWGARRQTSE